MTSSELFEDDFIGTLDFFQRYLWIGLFVACADDQGRFIDNHAIIRAKVFPFDRNVDDNMVEKAINKLNEDGKVVRYVAGNKHLIQITKWWVYQTPSWASPSKYPPPDKWTDRYRFHTIGNHVSTENWDISGGFEQGSTLRSRQGSAIDESEGEDDVKCESNVKSNKSSSTPRDAEFISHFGNFNGTREQKRWDALVDSVGFEQARAIAEWAEKRELER